jgi:hypothetical protein
MTGNAPLYVVCSPSRCVGKTLISRLLAEFHVLDGRPVAAFDLADEGPQLTDYLPELATIADIGDTRGQMAFFDQLIVAADGAKIIDVSHRTFKHFFAVVDEIGFFKEARRRSFEPLILFIADREPKSAEAYATLRRSFSDASLLPVRNQIEEIATWPGDSASADAAMPASLDIPLLGFSLRALIDQQSFSFSEFWRMTPPGPSDALDDELRSWIEGTFLQFRELEYRLAGSATLPGVALSRPRTRRAAPRQRPRAARPPNDQPSDRPSDRPADRSSDRTGADRDVPRRVLEFAPKRIRSVDDDVADHTGGTIVARLRQAAGEFRAAEDRIDQLQSEIEQVENRAVRAEAWLQVIRQEIEEKLIAPTAPSNPKP